MKRLLRFAFPFLALGGLGLNNLYASGRIASPATACGDGAAYCVVDLSGGCGAAQYPVSYLDDVPAGGWGEEYKTTKLVLRRIESGTFVMGSPTTERGRHEGEAQHRVTLSKGYYMGVFEITQRQWELVTGARPSNFSAAQYYATRPVECVSYTTIRGWPSGDWWPETREPVADSFVGVLQRKTGLAFDLPTEAQWEYACRAGTTTALNSGENLSDLNYPCRYLNVLARYTPNRTSGDLQPTVPEPSAGTATVGSYLPNAWGLYDMHGNVSEWCLDWEGAYSGDAVDPMGGVTSAGTGFRMYRGGGWNDEAQYCRSAWRNGVVPGHQSNSLGLRLVRNLDVVLTLDACGGTPEVPVVKVPTFGTPGALPRATRTGYGLVGWYTEPNGGGSLVRENTQVARDMTLYALWLPQKYCVIDLSAGADAGCYPVTYLDDVPQGGWTDAHKTTKLVLSRLPAGTFLMGSPENERGHYSWEIRHKVTLTKPFYMGVFEVTQRQWELVMGTRPSSCGEELHYAKRPVENVSYPMLRGPFSYEESENWPTSVSVDADSFFGRLRARTGLHLDLPTEAQWEYACRAGTTTGLNNGRDLTELDFPCRHLNELARYTPNRMIGNLPPEVPGSDTGTAEVGCYRPNAWGLYDMHGNVYEMCLDWYDAYTSRDQTDPVGKKPEFIDHVMRGGCWKSPGADCRSAARRSIGRSDSSRNCGFRIAAPDFVTVRLDACGGTCETTERQTVQFGTLVPLPRATREGYGLVGWYTEPNGGGTILREDTQIPRDMTLYAHWVPRKYCVIDLSGGTSATNYPVTYLGEIPEGGWSEDYKTEKLVLCRLPAGSFVMGSPASERGRHPIERQHKVTLTESFYVGVFEVTQRQWELVKGTRPSYFCNANFYAVRPVESVSYSSIRGGGLESTWPETREVGAGSFLGLIRRKTGLALDLPTEAQWEYACRAGTTNALNSGKELAEDYYACPNLNQLARYTPSWPTPVTPSATATLSGGTTVVGLYRPNAWGIYDMHGNVSEWCLDWYGNYAGDAVDPRGWRHGTAN